MATTKPRKYRKNSRKGSQLKKWKPIFFTKRPLEDSLFFDARESIEGFEREGGPLDAFLEDSESSVPSWEMSVIARFLRTGDSHVGPARTLARARLDDRKFDSDKCRNYPEWLTPSQLRDALALPVFYFHPT
jgi:hypothetical protein